ncbi:MAG: hypothetical protein WC343_08630 [Bacilli bacterium]|jgi:hypothetical protein
MTLTASTKFCPKCKRDLPLDCFSKNRAKRDGYASWCKEDIAKWTKEHRESINLYHREHREQITKWNRESRHRTGKCQAYQESPNCALYLGVHISERILSNYFENIERMPLKNPGYDFICGKGYKIDVKSSSLHPLKYSRGKAYDHPHWFFKINKNCIADYFFCLAFSNRASLEPLHVWLIPANIINRLQSLIITQTQLSKWSEYEKPIDKVWSCYTKLNIKGIATTQSIEAGIINITVVD